MVNSRKKGSVNERRVAQSLKEWSSYEFARTPQSGGLHWKKQHTSGDIVCIDEKHGNRYPFSIECKAHKEIELLPLIDHTYGKKTNKVMEFWKQSIKDAENHNKLPLVFMRKDGMKKGAYFVMMPTNFFIVFLENVSGLHIRFKMGIFHFTNPEHSFTVINSDDLFETDYQLFYKLGKKINRINRKPNGSKI